MAITLVAIAALAAATGAMAQSSVTLYGALDAGYSNAEYVKNSVSQVKRSGIALGANDTSRWGLTGKDDLGGGMSSEFKIESQIGQHPRAGLGGYDITKKGDLNSVNNYSYTNGSPEKGNGFTLDSTVLGNRELWAALNTNTGTTIKVGYGVTALRVLAVETDASASNVYGNQIGAAVGGFRRMGTRIDQSFGATTASFGIFGQDQKTTATDVGEVRVNKGYTANVQYKQGAINGGIGYDKARSSNPALVSDQSATGFALTPSATNTLAVSAADKEVSTVMAGGSYDLGSAKLFAQIWNQKADYYSGGVKSSSTTIGAGKLTGESIGVRVPVGAWTPFAQYYNGKNKVTVATGTAESRKSTGPSMGVKYDFSKRTYAYLVTGSVKTDASTAGSDKAEFKQTSFGLVSYF